MMAVSSQQEQHTKKGSHNPTNRLTQLVVRAQGGDRLATSALFETFKQSIMNYCFMHANGDRDHAKDLTQETFVRAFSKLSTLRDPARFRAWLYAIAHRICQNQGNSTTRYRQVLDAFELEMDVQLDGEDKLSRERRIQCVRELVANLADDQLRAIVQLKYTEPEHTTREIAAKLNIPHGTVTVKLMRFRAAIKQRLIVALRQVQ